MCGHKRVQVLMLCVWGMVLSEPPGDHHPYSLSRGPLLSGGLKAAQARHQGPCGCMPADPGNVPRDPEPWLARPTAQTQ